MNRRHAERNDHDPELEARIEAFELAFRMQVKAPEAFDVEKESEETKKLYGLDNEVTRDFGWQCLLARRLSERGVRFVQCSHSYKWDQHGELLKLHTKNAAEVDKPIAGLLKDLKARGLFKDTLVIWGGEFGRTPWAQGRRRPRSQSVRLHDLDGGRRRKARLHLRRDRRIRLPRRRESHAHPRSARDGPAHAGPAAREAHVSLCRPEFPSHRRRRHSAQRNLRMRRSGC